MWCSNIRCDIRDGKAYLENGSRQVIGCNGECCSCDLFRGVDISEVGMRSLSAFCLRRYMDKNRSTYAEHGNI